ncbi:MAG: hypothetical protein AAFQ84_10335 [Pseudomonadota bacterium]
MLRPKDSLVALAAMLCCIACATGPTPYQPATSINGFGYADQPIEQGRYRITYRARNVTEARTLVLRRAAELTLADGSDWFRVIDSYTETFGGGGARSGVSIGGATGGPNSSIGVGIGIPIGRSSQPREAEAGIEIVSGIGEKPDTPDAYDARSVIETAASVPVP